MFIVKIICRLKINCLIENFDLGRYLILLLNQIIFLLWTFSLFIYYCGYFFCNLIIFWNCILRLLIHYFVLSCNEVIFHFELLAWLIVLGNSKCMSHYSTFCVGYVKNVGLGLDEVVVVYNWMYLFRRRDWFFKLKILWVLIFDIWLLFVKLNKLFIINFKVSVCVSIRRDWIFWLAWNYIEVFKWPTLVIQ
jgi:hypothetical protein